MRRGFTALLLGGLLLVSSAAPTFAADARASCIGVIISDHAQWGDLPELVHDSKTLAAAFGLSFGGFVSSGAKQHLGSHAVCGGE